jgi:hypothetical protein
MPKAKPTPSVEVLNSLFTYDEITGELRWKIVPKERVARAKVGDIAGAVMTNGYRMTCINYQKYLVHRLIWKMKTGSDAPFSIDHIDGDRLNNRFANLRAATQSQNGMNSKMRKNNTSGVKGVYWHQSNRWQAQIMLHRKVIVLGGFDKIEEAASAVAEAREKYHGQFARTA